MRAEGALVRELLAAPLHTGSLPTSYPEEQSSWRGRSALLAAISVHLPEPGDGQGQHPAPPEHSGSSGLRGHQRRATQGCFGTHCRSCLGRGETEIMGNVLQQPQGFQRCLWCHEGEPGEQEVPQALGSPLRALSPQLGHFPASCPSGRSRAEAAGTRHLCHPAGTTLPSQPHSWLPWELRPWAGRCPPRGPRLSSALVRKGANSLRPPDGAHRVVPQGAARGNVAEQREICSGSGWGKAESKCPVF